MEKYELTTDTKIVDGKVLRRIKALRVIGDVKVGELGGWVEGEKNLSQDGDAWIFENAQIFGYAKVSGDAI